MDHTLLAIAGLAALGGVCQWLAWRLKLPSILFLLTAGIAVGPVLGIFDADALFGDLLFPFVSVAVAIILFEGGLTLKISDIRDHGAVVTRLITVGVLITWALLATTAHYVFDMPWSLALVFGSITVVSGPTVVKPLLKSIRPSDKVGHILNWEGILIDPVGVFLALLVFEFVLLDQPGSGFGTISLILAKLIIVGTLIGASAGFATAYALRRYLVPDYLVNVLTLIIVVCSFTLAETIQHESGLLAVTIMGVWLANTKGLHIEEILNFKEDLSVLLISTLFIVLASRLDIGLLPEYGWQILLLLAIAQFVIRPINAAVCTLGSDLSTAEKSFIGWLSPRGIVAAAISSLFVIRLQEAGVPKAELLVPLTFSLIIGTVVFQSLTSKRLANTLGISNPEPNGVLFFGINAIALALAEALRAESIKVVLSDISWKGVREARQAGFESYHGNPTSAHAEENLDLQGVGKLIAVSVNRDTNALAGLHYRHQFGSNAVFTLEGASDDDVHERFDTANRNRANPLFDKSLSHSRLMKRLREGEIRKLTLAEPTEETVEEHAEEPTLTSENLDSPAAVTGSTEGEKEQNATSDSAEREGGRTDDDSPAIQQGESEISETDLKLFAIDPTGKLYIYGAGEAVTPKPGWKVIVLRETPAQATEA